MGGAGGAGRCCISREGLEALLPALADGAGAGADAGAGEDAGEGKSAEAGAGAGEGGGAGGGSAGGVDALLRSLAGLISCQKAREHARVRDVGGVGGARAVSGGRGLSLAIFSLLAHPPCCEALRPPSRPAAPRAARRALTGGG